MRNLSIYSIKYGIFGIQMNKTRLTYTVHVMLSITRLEEKFLVGDTDKKENDLDKMTKCRSP